MIEVVYALVVYFGNLDVVSFVQQKPGQHTHARTYFHYRHPLVAVKGRGYFCRNTEVG